MRKSFGLGCVLASLVACGGGSGSSPGDDVAVDPDAAVQPDARGFKVVSKEIEIPANTEITYCYYFRTPNTERLAIHKWSSTMTPGSHHMIMYTTASDVMPPGTISDGDCGLGTGGLSNQPAWTYAAQTQTAELALPDDDGTGKPLAQDIEPNTPAYFQMHYLNATDGPLMVHVELTAQALEPGVAYTKTAPYITYDDDIMIGEQETHVVTNKTCQTPPNTKFWMMSTHAHKQATETEVTNNGEVTFSSTDWEHPGVQEWMTAPFYTFADNQLSWSCTYDVQAPHDVIVSGPSAQTNEMCMATGYYFPATAAKFCYCPTNAGSCFLL